MSGGKRRKADGDERERGCRSLFIGEDPISLDPTVSAKYQNVHESVCGREHYGNS